MPSSLGAVTRSGQESAPDYIRGLSRKPLAMFADTGDSSNIGKIRDMGNIYASSPNLDGYLEDIACAIEIVSKRSKRIVTVGGDDSVSYGVVDGLKRVYEDIALVHYDAHTDTYGDEECIDHGNWVLFAHEELEIPVLQKGCRTTVNLMPYQDEIENRPIFISIDMDVIDPSFAPGVSCPVPLGMTPKNLLKDIYKVCESSRVVGISLNEVNVDRDINGITGLLANSILLRAITTLNEYK